MHQETIHIGDDNYDAIFREVLEIDDTLFTYIEQLKDIKPLEYHETVKLHKSARAGDKSARKQLIAMNLRIVVKMGLRYHKKYGIPLSDAIQSGSIGMIIALGSFNINKHEKFAEYFPYRVRQSIVHSNPISPLIRYSFGMMDKLVVAYEQEKEHSCELCDTEDFCPNLVEWFVARDICGPKEAAKLLAQLVPMDSVERLQDENENAFPDEDKSDMLGAPSKEEIRACIKDMLDILSEREYVILALRFGLDGTDVKSYGQIADMYCVTGERIRQLETMALWKLRRSSKKTRYKRFWQLDSPDSPFNEKRYSLRR